MKFLSDILVKAGLTVENTFSANAASNTIYAGAGTRLRTEANNLVFERVSSSGFMKLFINQTTLAATAKSYLGYNNATLNVVLSNEHAVGGLELRTQDVIRQQIFSNGNTVIGQASPVDAGYKLDVFGTVRLSSTTTLTSLAGTGDRMVVADSSGVLSTQAIPALTGYVPYTGATANLDLGEYGLNTGFVKFDTTPTNTPTTQGTMSWNVDKESLDLIMNGVTGSIMQDSFFNVKNQTGSSIPKGTVVRAAGTVGASGRILIAPFLADGTYNSKFCIGVTAETIADGADGKVTAFGSIRQIDTSAFPNGTVLYASPTTAGGFTSTEPSNPNNIVTVAIVVYSDNNNGEIFVRPTFISSQADLINSLGFTPVTNARTLTINGTTYDLTADRSWSVGTHTGSLTSGYIPKATGTTSLTDGLLYDTGSAVLLGTQTAGSGKFMVYSTTADNHYQAVGAAPSFRFADAITNPTYTGIIGMATASNNFIIGAAAGDMVLSNNTNSAGNFLFGTGATERMRINATTGNISINNTNNTFRLDVTGTVRFTGQLTLGSTITNGTFTYTLPGATGTLALTSDIQTGYVPYTGATADVNLGTYALTGKDLTVGGAGTTTGRLNFTQRTSALLVDSGATYLTAAGTADLFINYSQGNGNYRVVSISSALLSNNTLRYHYLPDKNGTFAMTSDLSGYITLGSLSASSPLSYNSGTGAFSIQQASSSTSGFLSSTDWNTFNNKTSNTGTVTSVGLSSATSGVTIGSTPITTSGTITLAIATASGSQQGLLSSTDWTTFNNKQSALTNPVTGTGTTNYLPKFTGASTIGNSLVYDNGTSVGIGISNPNIYDSNADNLVIGSTGANDKNGITIVGGDTDGRGAIYFADTTQNSAGFITYLHSNNRLLFGTSDTTRVTLDASGNLGLGVSPSAWSLSGLNVMQVKNGFWYGYQNETSLGVNAYFDGSSWKYIASAEATRYGQNSGIHAWYTAPSGTAGNAISFTQAMTLDASGNLGLGTTGPVLRLDVQGNVSDTTTVSGVTVEQVSLFRPSNGVGGIRTGFNTSTGDAYIWSANSGSSINFGTRSAPNNTAHLSLASTGAATFSSSVSVNSSASNIVALDVSGNTGSGVRQRFLNQSASGLYNFQIGTHISAANAFEIGASSATDGTSFNNVFKILNTGAATFSNNVTTTSSTGAFAVVGAGSSNTNAGSGRFVIYDTTNNRGWGMQQDASYKLNFWHYNGSWSSVANISGTGAATFSSSVTAGNFTGTYFDYKPGGTETFFIGKTSYNVFDGNQLGLATFTSIPIEFATANTRRMIITSGGNVGIGTTSPGATYSELLQVSKSDVGRINVTHTNTSSTRQSDILFTEGTSLQFQVGTILGSGTFSDQAWLRGVSNIPMVFYTNDTERMRITSGGFVGIGTTAPDYQLEVKANTTNYSTMVKNSSTTTPNGLYIYFDQSSSSNTTQQFLRAESTAGQKAAIYTNGTFGSATSTYGGISDIKLKENIISATPKLSDLLKVNVVNYNFIKDKNKEKHLGVIAQELETIFPNMVFETIDDKTGESIKSVKYSIFIPMLIKGIQELKAELDNLKNK